MLRFHEVHGNNIQLEDEEHKAVRNSQDSFCDGVTFSDEPLQLGEMYCIGITGWTDVTDWSGALRLGVTTEDPTTIINLPKYACPDLVAREGFWARPVKEELAQDGTRLSFSLTLNGELQLCINNHCVGAHLTDLPVASPLWLIVDIYGSTQAVQFYREENIPAEILARGPAAVEAYHKLRRSGTAPLYRGRVFLVGLDSVGKKWLKISLLGESEAHESETPLEGISCRRWCSIDKDGRWKTKTKEDKQPQPGGQKQQRNFDGQEPIRIESDFDAALARNLAIEILKSQQNKKKDQVKMKSASEKSRIRLSSSDSFGQSWKSNLKPNSSSANSQKSIRKGNRVAPVSELSMKQIPSRLIPLVENHLKDLKKREQQVFKKSDGEKKVDDVIALDDEGPSEITISFWELGGHPDLIPVLHPFITGEAVYILVFDLMQELDSQSKVVEWEEKNSQFVMNESEHYTNLDILLSWINIIYQQRTHPEKNTQSIIIVGVNRQHLHSDIKMQESMANLKFDQIRDSIKGSSFEKLVCETYFAVDTSDPTKFQ